MSRLPALLLAASLLLAGCVGVGPTGPASPTTDPGPDPSPTATGSPTPTQTTAPSSPSETPTPVEDGTPTPDDGTPYGTSHYGPDPSHEIVVSNRLDGEATLHVRVVRTATNETVYDESVTLPPGERVVYNTARASPDGIEEFRIVAERGGERESVVIETSECYGDAILSPTDAGGVDATYSIC